MAAIYFSIVRLLHPLWQHHQCTLCQHSTIDHLALPDVRVIFFRQHLAYLAGRIRDTTPVLPASGGWQYILHFRGILRSNKIQQLVKVLHTFQPLRIGM